MTDKQEWIDRFINGVEHEQGSLVNAVHRATFERIALIEYGNAADNMMPEELGAVHVRTEAAENAGDVEMQRNLNAQQNRIERRRY